MPWMVAVQHHELTHDERGACLLVAVVLSAFRITLSIKPPKLSADF